MTEYEKMHNGMIYAAGNPCKVIREITEKDSMYLKAKK